MAPRLFEQKQTKLRGISYYKISLGGFTLLTAENSAIIPLSFYLCLMHDIRACLHGGGGPQVGEVTRLGGVTWQSI